MERRIAIAFLATLLAATPVLGILVGDEGAAKSVERAEDAANAAKEAVEPAKAVENDAARRTPRHAQSDAADDEFTNKAAIAAGNAFRMAAAAGDAAIAGGASEGNAYRKAASEAATAGSAYRRAVSGAATAGSASEGNAGRKVASEAATPSSASEVATATGDVFKKEAQETATDASASEAEDGEAGSMELPADGPYAPRWNCDSPDEWGAWTVDKKEWCCRAKQVGCMLWCKEMAIGTRGWTIAKLKFCCVEYKVGCDMGQRTPATGFECTSDGWHTWEHEWSLQKKAWCCKNRAIGCGSAATPLITKNQGYQSSLLRIDYDGDSDHGFRISNVHGG